MNIKYCFVKNKMNYDEVLIPYLEEMSRKGWELESLHTFAKFKKCNHELKYQIDYNPLSEEYKDILDSLGYKHVMCILDRHIYCNENLDAEDLSSDEDVIVQSKLKLFPKWAIALELICAFVFIMCGYTFTDWFHFSLGSLYMYLQLYASSFIFYEIGTICILSSIVLFIKRNLIIKDKFYYKNNKYLDLFVMIISYLLILSVLFISIYILNLTVIPLIIEIIIILVVLCVFRRIIQNVLPKILNKNIRKILMVITVCLFLVVYNLNLDDKILEGLHLTKNTSESTVTIHLPENKINEGSFFSSILLKGLSFGEVIGYDEFNEKEYSDERYYLCKNNNIAKEVYKELVIEQDRSNNDNIDYDTYENVKKNVGIINTKYFNECLKIGKYSIGIKDNVVVKVYNYDIDDFYENQ